MRGRGVIMFDSPTGTCGTGTVSVSLTLSRVTVATSSPQRLVPARTARSHHNAMSVKSHTGDTTTHPVPSSPSPGISPKVCADPKATQARNWYLPGKRVDHEGARLLTRARRAAARLTAGLRRRAQHVRTRSHRRQHTQRSRQRCLG